MCNKNEKSVQISETTLQKLKSETLRNVKYMAEAVVTTNSIFIFVCHTVNGGFLPDITLRPPPF